MGLGPRGHDLRPDSLEALLCLPCLLARPHQYQLLLLAPQTADVWSCGVMLYVMLVGAYPFERPEDKHDNQKLQKMIQASRRRLLVVVVLIGQK